MRVTSGAFGYLPIDRPTQRARLRAKGRIPHVRLPGPYQDYVWSFNVAHSTRPQGTSPVVGSIQPSLRRWAVRHVLNLPKISRSPWSVALMVETRAHGGSLSEQFQRFVTCELRAQRIALSSGSILRWRAACVSTSERDGDAAAARLVPNGESKASRPPTNPSSAPSTRTPASLIERHPESRTVEPRRAPRSCAASSLTSTNPP